MEGEQIIFMTGATSGFGKIIAKEMASSGSTVVVLARSSDKANILLQEFSREYPTSQGKIEVIQVNLNSFQSIVKGCQEFRENYQKLNTLILNAGLMNFSFKETQDGFEETLQVNLLAPILITHLLIDLVDKNSNSKIIFTTSGLHQGTINFNDIEFRKKFTGFKVYRQSKLGIILMTRYLAKLNKNDRLVYFTIHPGLIRTELGRDAGWLSKIVFYLIGKPLEMGAQTHLDLLRMKNEDIVSGEYYAYSKVKSITPESNDMEMAANLNTLIYRYLEPYLGNKQSE